MLDELPDRIKQHVLDFVNKQYPKDDNRIWVTDILYCLRKAYYRRKNPKPIPLDQAWRMYIGTLIHNDIEGAYNDPDKKFEVPIYNTGAVLVGKYDVLDDDTIYELKVVDSNYKYFLDKKGPSEEYKNQLRIYMHVKGKQQGKLAYLMHKDAIMVPITLEGFSMDEMLTRAAVLWDALKTNTLPPKTEEAWQCKMCEYREECMKEKNEV